jgi:hypothetical protein
VFDEKCYIIEKKKDTKFALKAYEGFFLGYDSNSHAYRVLNNLSWRDEEAVDADIEECNGSQLKHLAKDVEKHIQLSL